MLALAQARDHGLQPARDGAGQDDKMKLSGKALAEREGWRNLSCPGRARRILVEEQGRGVVEVTPAAVTAVGSYDLLVTHGRRRLSTAVKVFVADMTPYRGRRMRASDGPPCRSSCRRVLMGGFESAGMRTTSRSRASKDQLLVFDARAANGVSKADGGADADWTPPAGRESRPTTTSMMAADALLRGHAAGRGEYTLKVTTRRWGRAEGASLYRVHAGGFALVTGTYPMGVPANSEIEVQLLGVQPSGGREGEGEGPAGAPARRRWRWTRRCSARGGGMQCWWRRRCGGGDRNASRTT